MNRAGLLWTVCAILLLRIPWGFAPLTAIDFSDSLLLRVTIALVLPSKGCRKEASYSGGASSRSGNVPNSGTCRASMRLARSFSYVLRCLLRRGAVCGLSPSSSSTSTLDVTLPFRLNDALFVIRPLRTRWEGAFDNRGDDARF